MKKIIYFGIVAIFAFVFSNIKAQTIAEQEALIKKWQKDVASYKLDKNPFFTGEQTSELAGGIFSKKLFLAYESKPQCFKRISITKIPITEVFSYFIKIKTTDVSFFWSGFEAFRRGCLCNDVYVVSYKISQEKSCDPLRIEELFSHIDSIESYPTSREDCTSTRDGIFIFIYDSLEIDQTYHCGVKIPVSANNYKVTGVPKKENYLFVLDIYPIKKQINKKPPCPWLENLGTKEEESKPSEASFTLEDSSAHIAIWDFGSIDGDIVNVYVDGVLKNKNFKLTDKKFILNVSAGQKITIEAVDEGSAPPCTVTAEVLETGESKSLQAKQNEIMKINLMKQ